LNKNIPFAYHGVRATKMGSLFPSYHASIQEKNRKRMETDFLLLEEEGGDKKGRKDLYQAKLDSKNKKKPLEKFDLDGALKKMTSQNGAGAGNSASTFFLTELDDEIRRITGEEYLQSHRIDHTELIKDELDLEYQTYLDRIARMKTIWNKLLIIQREKERIITEMEKEVSCFLTICGLYL
jgi:hypothetical protein